MVSSIFMTHSNFIRIIIVLEYYRNIRWFLLFPESVDQNGLCISWLYCPRKITKEGLYNHTRTREIHGSHFWISSFKLILFLGVNKKELKRDQGDIPEKFTGLTTDGKGGLGGKRLRLQCWSSSGPNIVLDTATAMLCPLWSLLFPGNVDLLFVLSNFELLKNLK